MLVINVRSLKLELKCSLGKKVALKWGTLMTFLSDSGNLNLAGECNLLLALSVVFFMFQMNFKRKIVLSFLLPPNY